MPKNKKRGPSKPNGMNLAQAKSYEKQVRKQEASAEGYAIFQNLSGILQQEIIDAAFMAANDMFHMGPGRCEQFGRLIIYYRDEIVKIINSDYEDDKDLDFAKGMIDRRLQQICGDKFDPWEVRYDMKDGGEMR